MRCNVIHWVTNQIYFNVLEQEVEEVISVNPKLRPFKLDTDRKAAAIDGTDRRTLDRYIDPAPHTVRPLPTICSLTTALLQTGLASTNQTINHVFLEWSK